MSEQNDKRKPPYVEQSPSWQFPKTAVPKNVAPGTQEQEQAKTQAKSRVPASLFKGRLRTSTLALVILYALLDVTKKPIPAPEPPAQPWAPPTNAVFGTDGNWTVPAQIPTTRQYYQPPQRTWESPKPSASQPPSTSDSPSESPSTSESTTLSTSPSRSSRSSDTSSPSPSPTAGSGPSAASAPRTSDHSSNSPSSPSVNPPDSAACPSPGKSPTAARENSSP